LPTEQVTDPAKADQLARAVRALPMAGELAQILDMEFEALQKQTWTVLNNFKAAKPICWPNSLACALPQRFCKKTPIGRACWPP
jgi:hypothetical protein